MVEFRVLGPVEAWHEGVQVPLGHRRQRLILAALLLSPNQVVTTEELIAALWGESPPRSARGMLHSRICVLRGVLADTVGDAARVTTAPPGYLLHVDPLDVDLHRFAALVEAARRAPDDRTVRQCLRKALALWRGSPLGGWVPHAGRWCTLDRMESMRLTAAEDLFDAELRLGRHAAVIDELWAFADAHPARERLTGQLMLALCRAGRRAEALRVYEQNRRWLADELGVDPSPTLRRLCHDFGSEAGTGVAAGSTGLGLPGRARRRRGRRRVVRRRCR